MYLGIDLCTSEIKFLLLDEAHREELPWVLHRKSEAENLRKGLLVYHDLHNPYGVPTEKYAEEAFKTVRTFLDQFAETLYVAIHPVALEDDA